MARVGEQLGASFEALREVFHRPALRRLQSAWALSMCGEWVFIVALAVYAYDRGGVVALGVLAVLRMVPAALVAPFAATVADRYRRERVLVAVEAARGLLLLVAAAAVAFSSPPAVPYVLASVLAMISTVHRPTQAALLPSLAATPEELTAANAALSTIESLGTLVGPAIAGVMLALTGPDAAFVAAGTAYLLSAFLLTGISADPPPAGPERPDSFLRDALGGFGALAAERNPRLLVGLFGAQTLVRGSLNVLIVVVSLSLLRMGPSGVGYLTSAIGAGGLVGGVVTIFLIGRRRLAAPFGAGIILWGLPIAGLGLFPNRVAAFAMLLVLGIGNSVVDVAGLTLLQRTVPGHVLARVLGVLEGLIMGSIGLGAVLTPVLTTRLGVRTTLVVVGGLLPVLVLVSFRRLRTIDEESVAPGDRFALLHSLPFFEALPLATLEYLTGRLIPVPYGDGEIVIREGDPGDRFYVIESGAVDVRSGDRLVTSLGAGGYVGEIALLKDVPRTATVVANGDAHLLALERDDFLGAVTGHADSADAIDAAMVARLQSLGPQLTSF